ncbi:MAG: hypothetical protein WEE51_09935, partial [Pirellulaceae bacterium]
YSTRFAFRFRQRMTNNPTLDAPASHRNGTSGAVPGWVSLSPKFRKKLDIQSWEAWRSHLQQREKPHSVRSIFKGQKVSPLSWAYFAADTLDERTHGLLENLWQVARGKGKKAVNAASMLQNWLADLDQRLADRNLALELLAWTYALPELACRLDENTWWNLFGTLYSHGVDAQATSFDNPVFEQALAGELPLALGLQFPELSRSGELIDTACRIIEQGLSNLTDGQGMLSASNLRHTRPLLATWTRSTLLARQLGKRKLNRDAQLQFDWLVRQAVRLTRGDGTQGLGLGLAARYSKALFESALELVEDPEDREIAEATLPPGKRSLKKLGHLSLPSYESAWSNLAILRTDWSVGASRCLVTHDRPELEIELETRRELLLSGRIVTQLTIAGASLEPEGEWEQVGWMADDDGDYLELEQTWTGDVKLQRLIFLAREDQFLWFADTVLAGENGGRIEYRCQLPIQQGVAIHPTEETRDVHLLGKQAAATLLPVALSEWRSDPRLGKVETDQGVTIEAVGEGYGLHVPLFFDLDASHRDAPRTWRHLTVAEKLEYLPRDKAVAYRVQVGKRQWIFYRSLTAKANRTFLGVNLISETLIARLSSEGEVEKLLEVVAAEE